MLGSPRLHIVKVNDFLEGIGEGGGVLLLVVGDASKAI